MSELVDRDRRVDRSRSTSQVPVLGDWDFDNGPTRFFKFKDPKIREDLLDAVRMGNYIYVACRRVGVSENMYYSWKFYADETRKQGNENEFTRFFDELEKAQLESEANLVNGWYLAALTNPVAAEAFLKRRHPERWAEKQPDKPASMGPVVQIFLPDNDRGDNPRVVSPDVVDDVEYREVGGAIALPQKQDEGPDDDES